MNWKNGSTIHLFCKCGVSLNEENSIKENRNKSGRRGICKLCYSSRETISIILKLANQNPENYMTCNDCDAIFTKTKRGRYLAYKTNCPKCYSKNIEKY